MATRLGLFALGVGRQQLLQRRALGAVVARQTTPLRYSRFSTSSISRSSPSTNPTTEPNGQPKKKSPHVSFYSVYGRALSKVMLMSLLIYQGFYYGWMYLEHLEVKHEKEDKR
ncbi:hypothetical protein TWF481_000286 [Arthrobotrys musiformis]|uniref:Uncharacterized protein n=1 Tax=Arthrobotrys musiformis TaxID=47236 RepID=A0AAV9WN31_9PEZI